MPLTDAVLPSPVREGSYIGPKVFTRGRDHYYEARDNETASVLDRKWGEPEKVARKLTVVVEQGTNILPLQNRVQRVEAYRDEIREHAGRRVAIFFQQLVCVYKTGLHFEEGKTTHQGKGEGSIVLKDGQRRQVTIQHQAAHSSTIPALTAYYGREWAQYKAGQGDEPEGFVYMRDSDHWRINNATMDLPEEVNKADSRIDFQGNKGVLRKHALVFVNRCARGAIIPEEGLRQFLKDAKRVARRAIPGTSGDAVKRVLQFYIADFGDFLLRMEDDETFCDRLLDVRVDDSDEAARMRGIAYRLRYRAIRQLHLEQSALLQKVEEAREAIFAQVNGTYWHRQKAFRDRLVYHMRTDADKQRVKKLFNMTGEGVYIYPEEKLRVTVSRKRRFASTKAKMAEHDAAIRTLARELSRQMRRLRVEEVQKRGAVMRALRHEKGWRQVDLGSEIIKHYTIPASQPTISRTERGERLIGRRLAEQLSRVFKVDSGLFMPNFFYS